MPRFTVTCADRETGDDYEITITADSKAAAIKAATNQGHIVADASSEPKSEAAKRVAAEFVGTRQPSPPPTRPDFPPTSDPILSELRLIRRALDDLPRSISKTKVTPIHITAPIAIGVAIGMFVFGLVAFGVNMLLSGSL